MSAPTTQIPGAQPIPELTLEQLIERTVVDGDLARFRELVFADYGAKLLTERAVKLLTEGFPVGTFAGATIHQSFVAKCLTHDRPEFVREVMECAREYAKRLPGDEPSVFKDWFGLLCSARTGDELEFVSPPQMVRDRQAEITDYREFIIMTLEYMPLDEGLYRARTRSDENCAFIAECEMELRIRQVKAATPMDETISAPARRLRCL